MMSTRSEERKGTPKDDGKKYNHKGNRSFYIGYERDFTKQWH